MLHHAIPCIELSRSITLQVCGHGLHTTWHCAPTLHTIHSECPKKQSIFNTPQYLCLNSNAGSIRMPHMHFTTLPAVYTAHTYDTFMLWGCGMCCTRHDGAHSDPRRRHTDFSLRAGAPCILALLGVVGLPRGGNSCTCRALHTPGEAAWPVLCVRTACSLRPSARAAHCWRVFASLLAANSSSTEIL